MAGTIIVDRIESDASYTSTINVANRITFSNTVNFGVFAGTAPVAGFYLPTTNNLAFTTASTERMRIDSAGNVGIGTSSPAVNLEVKASSGSGEIRIDSSASDILQLQSSATESRIAAVSAVPLTFRTSNIERMRIDSSGNVGIGTSSPNIGGANTDNAILTLKGKASTRGGIFEMGSFGTTGNDQTLGWNRYFDGSTENANIEVARASSTSTAYMKFSTNGGSGVTERMRIDSAGRLSINSTSNLDTSRLFVQMSSGDNAMSLRSYDSSSSVMMLQFYTSGNTRIGFIQTVSGTSTTFSTSSDYRLKEDITPMTGALAKVVLLKPVTYKWKSNGKDGQGFIAHELQEVVPDCVTGTKDAVDEDGKPVHQGVDTSFLVATLTAAIQEQQTLITQLTERIAALENN